MAISSETDPVDDIADEGSGSAEGAATGVQRRWAHAPQADDACCVPATSEVPVARSRSVLPEEKVPPMPEERWSTGNRWSKSERLA